MTGKLLERLSEKGDTALIVGVNTGFEVDAFPGVAVTGVDLLPPYRHDYQHVRGPLESADLGTYDIVYCSHVLEHVRDPGRFIDRLLGAMNHDGWLGLVVPPYPQETFFVGHLTLWTPALLLYHLVCAGQDCRAAEWYTTNQHIAVMVQRKPIEPSTGGFDVWEQVKGYMPCRFEHQMNAWLPGNWDLEKAA